MNRNGEKWGWIGGWCGGFIWVVILSVIMLVQGQALQGIIGLVLAGIAVVLIIMTAPWKHPHTPYWKLMLPVYVMFLTSLVWAAWSYNGVTELGLSGWSGFLILPILIPFWTTGRRRWGDAND